MGSRRKRQKRELAGLAARKRTREALRRPCPDCGQLPGVQYLDEDGRDINTGRPACGNCKSVMEAVNPAGVAMIQGYGIDPDAPDDYDEDDPDAA